MKSKALFLFFILIQGMLMGASIKHMQIEEKSIPVVYEKNNMLPIFNMQLVFKNSGYSQDNDHFGITNLLAKVLNEGTKQDGSVSFARKLESKAISLHATNGYETFVIELSCLKEQYKEALDYLEELLLDPNITQNTLEKVKMIQISKLKQKENDFDYLAERNLKSLVFKDSKLEYGNIGTIDSIEKTTLENLKSRFKTLLNLDNLIIVAGGDIGFKELKQEIYPIFSKFQFLEETRLKRTEIHIKNKELIDFRDTQQAYIYFASPFSMNYNDKDIYKAKIASFILGGSGFGSRLMEEIRVKKGLAYSVYANIQNHRSHAYFSGYLQTKVENEVQAKKLIKKLIKEFIQNGVTQKELDAAKKFILGSEPLRTETFSQRLARAFNLFYKGLPLDYPEIELEKIKKLKLKELNSFIKNHDELNNLNFSIITQQQKGK